MEGAVDPLTYRESLGVHEALREIHCKVHGSIFTKKIQKKSCSEYQTESSGPVLFSKKSTMWFGTGLLGRRVRGGRQTTEHRGRRTQRVVQRQSLLAARRRRFGRVAPAPRQPRRTRPRRRRRRWRRRRRRRRRRGVQQRGAGGDRRASGRFRPPPSVERPQRHAPPGRPRTGRPARPPADHHHRSV